MVNLNSFKTNAELLKSVIELDLNTLTEEQKHELTPAAENAELKDTSEIKDILESSNPTDYVIYSKENALIFVDYMYNSLDIVQSTIDQMIPADICIANTIPIIDVVFKVDIFDIDDTAPHHSIFVRCLYKNDQLYIIVQDKHGDCCVMTTKRQSEEWLVIDDTKYWIDNLDEYALQYLSYRHSVKAVVLHIANYFLGIWYTLQIMMLNPVLKERLFVNSNKEKLRTSNSGIIGNSEQKSKKRKAKYIRYKNLNSIVMNSDVIRKQHTLCWYVIGHYRHYSSGKKTWINGYWKGPLRELQKNLDEGRERILAQ